MHRCSLCTRRFHSLQAVGGHQNDHHDQRNEMHRMYLQVLARKQRQVREGKRILFPTPARAKPTPSKAHNSHHQLTALVDSDPAEIDLELRLRCGPRKKVITFYEFLPIKKGHGYDIGGPSGSGVKETCAEPETHPTPNHVNGQSLLFPEPAELPLMDGANGGGGGGGGFLQASVGVLSGGSGITEEVTSMIGHGRDSQAVITI